jgi:arginyl-tRNA synthetase
MLDQLKRLQEINAELTELVKSMLTDIKELQDQTGITFDRWRETRKEQNLLYIRDRIEYHRSHGEGMMGAKVLAVKDLRELHQREFRNS